MKTIGSTCRHARRLDLLSGGDNQRVPLGEGAAPTVPRQLNKVFTGLPMS
jgi:hypothetical protein